MRKKDVRLVGNLLAVLIIGGLLLSCSGTQTNPIENALPPTETVTATITATHTHTPTITPGPTATWTPTPVPTPPGGSLGGRLLVRSISSYS